MTETLKKNPLFSGLDDNGLQKVMGITRRQFFQKGQVLFSQGDRAEVFYLVISGRIKIYRLSLNGQEYVMRIVGPGETMAEAAVFSEKTYPASAEALEEAQVFCVPKFDFIELIRESPQLALNMMTGMSLLLRNLAQQVDDLSLKEISARLARFLISEAEKTGKVPADGINIPLNLKKNILASRLGTIGETLSRTLNKLKQKAVVEINKDAIKILSIHKLKEIAEGAKL
jgi:CRP/FNR family transcriptional regulator